MNQANLTRTQLHPAADVRKTARIGLGLLLTGFAAITAWAGFAPLSGAIIAQGVVKVESNRKTVQHLEGGIVKEILVKEGQQVRSGQGLVIIADGRMNAEMASVSAELDAEMARAARLRAERDESGTIDFPESLRRRIDEPRVSELMRIERVLFETKHRALHEQLVLIQDQVAEIKREQAALDVQMQADSSGAALLNEELEANERLHKLNFISKAQLLKLQRGMEEYRSRQGGSAAAIARAKQKNKEIEIRGTSLRDQHRQDAANEYALVQARIVGLEERVKPARDAVLRQAVVAPIAGTVVDLKVFTVGGAVAPREPLLDIVPGDNPLIVEARLNLDDIRHLNPGLAADVRFTAYDSRNTPMVAGQLSYVSADRLTDARDGTSYYLAHVRVDSKSLESAKAIHLQPGMRAEVFLRTGERTALDYLLDPITSSVRRGMRES